MFPLKEVSYNEAHNMVWGAIAFAEEAGIEPCKEFALAQYFLEDDTDDIPLIEYDYGKDGKHFLVAQTQLELSGYLSVMKKHLTADQYEFMLEDDDDDDDMEDDNDEDDSYDTTHYPCYYQVGDFPYTYHGTYPSEKPLQEFPEVEQLFESSDSYLVLQNNDIDKILALPHDKLRKQLEQTVKYGLFRINGKNGEVSDQAGVYDQIIMHSIIFLGEVGAVETSLGVALETLRQSSDIYDFLYGDGASLMVVPTLAKLGLNSLPTLMDFMLEQGICNNNKMNVIEAVSSIAVTYPEKYQEVIEWFETLIDHIIEAGPSAKFTNYSINGIIVSELLNLRAEKLLPKIEVMYDRKLVEAQVCGNWQEVEYDMKLHSYSATSYIMPIKEIYKELAREFRTSI